MTTTTPTWNLTTGSITAAFARLAEDVEIGRYSSLGDTPLLDVPDVFKASSDKVWKDVVFFELVEAAQAHDELALLTVMRLMTPKIVKMTPTIAALDLETHSDAIRTMLSALWESVMTHNTATSRKNIPYALVLNALNNVNKSSGRVPTDVQITSMTDSHSGRFSMDGEILYNDASTTSTLTTQEQNEKDLSELLAWSLEQGVLDREDVTLMARFYLSSSVEHTVAEQAAELGITVGTLRRRAHRIRARLIKAVRERDY